MCSRSLRSLSSIAERASGCPRSWPFTNANVSRDGLGGVFALDLILLLRSNLTANPVASTSRADRTVDGIWLRCHHPVMELTIGEEDKLRSEVIERLSAQYPDVAADSVRSIVLASWGEFTGSPIRNFVPVLAERDARRHLGAAKPV